LAFVWFLKNLKVEKEIAGILKKGGVGILATDTLYGLVGSALSKKAVSRIYKVRRRSPKKPMIILISSLGDLNLFKIKIYEAKPRNIKLRKWLKKFWPGKVSVVLDCPSKKFAYLHRGTKTLAFRLPNKKYLLDLIKKVGPIAAPSANIEGMPPAQTISQAKKYFGDKVDFYVDAGKLFEQPSTLIKIENNRIIVLRQGAKKICRSEL